MLNQKQDQPLDALAQVALQDLLHLLSANLETMR
jgi:hypothetical protein